ncbi:MAG TPA: hypothetical protein VF290_17320 [Pyrinomonadaceae bacterium]
MANTPDMATCVGGEHGLGELLPLSPYNALSYHFGMLLGVDDFETEQAYHRAKHRLHNAWLHREGVVWGFDVRVDNTRGEIRVTPGLALDAAGRELHLEADACLNVEKWLEKNEKDPNLEVEVSDTEKKIKQTHIVIRFKACLTRQVPAFMEPCNNAGTGTAYSRVFETVEILMRPGPAPVKDPPYHRLRLLFGLEPPDTKEGAVTESDQQVLDALAAIQALPVADQPPALMAAFHRFAALDEIDLKPATSEDDARTLLFPGRDDEAVVLANITDLTLTKNNDKWALTAGEVDNSVRPSHVATTTIQDLLCGPAFGGAGTGGSLGPQADHASVKFPDARTIEFTVSKSLQPASVTVAAFSVTTFDSTAGWQTSTIDTATYDDTKKTVTLKVAADLSGRVRLIAKGTGPTPLLGNDLVPLAGALGGPAGSTHDGHDFVHQQDFAIAQPPEEPVAPADEPVDPGSNPDDAQKTERSRTRRGRRN